MIHRQPAVTHPPDHLPNPSRRHFLRLGIVFSASLALPGSLYAALTPADHQERRLVFFNTHTREKLDVCYAQGQSYRPDALAAVNHILRDHRTNDIKPIDTRLLDLLYDIRSRAGRHACVHIISGYRSPRTNRILRKRSHGVARKSLHMKGHAADIRIPGISTDRLRRIAADLKQGGVGYYPRANFVHVDIGSVRSW
ncbi:MAG: DUF882 domain-containing protein [Desulfosarcina sp.]|nr:DUF882 domain-containing protein [Desulfobacterales bacterium]